MELAANEAYQLHELAMSCVNSITNMGLFLNQVQDQKLRSMIERHFPLHIRDYNMKAEYLSKAEGATESLPVPDIKSILPSFTQSNVAIQPVKPRIDVQSLNDREIATAYLLTLKRAGREYAWSAMETSNPEVRAFLEDAFKMSSHHAHEVWQWMVENGYYPLEAASQKTLSTFGKLYQTVEEPVLQMQ